MKKRNVIDPFTRRSFFGSLGKGLTSIAALPQIFFPTKVSAATNHPDPLSDVEDWFKKIKGTHRIEYDAPSITKDSQFLELGGWATYLRPYRGY